MSGNGGDTVRFEDDVNPSAGSNATSIQGVPVSSTPPTLGQVLEYDGSQWGPSDLPPSGVNSVGTTSPIGNTGTASDPVLALTGSVPLAAIATALNTGGDPIKATVLTATTRIESPSVGADSSNQHGFPSGTGTLLDANSSLAAANLTGTISGARLPTGIQTKYTTAGTYSWTANANTKRFYVEIYGAGAGGASGRQGTAGSSGGGGGGGGGAYTAYWFSIADVSSPQSVVVGAGGVGGTSQATASTDGRAGTSGGDSSFGSLLYAKGGNGGTAGSTGNAAQTTAVVGLIASGGVGGAGMVNNAGVTASQTTPYATGGGGGGGGPTASVFKAGGNGQFPSPFATAGQAGGSTAGQAGTDGNSNATGGGNGGGGGASGDQTGATAGGAGGKGGGPGGGGGGGGGSVNGAASGAGGLGADGAVWITEYFS